MRKRCEGYRNQSSALPSRASCSRCFMALNPIVPIRKRKDKNLALSATFLRLGAASISLNTDIGSKVQQINCWEAFSVFCGWARIANRKKVAERARFLFSKRADSYNRADVAAGGAETGSLPQPAVPRGRRCCSWQCCNEGGASAGFISVAGRAAAGRCCGGRVSAVGRILRKTRETSLASAVQNEGRHCCAAERSHPECQLAALRSRRRESGAKGPL